ATSPAGVALGGVGAIGPLAQRALAAGFTAQQIQQGLQAGTLQEQVESALGAATAGLGAIAPEAVEVPRTVSETGLERTAEPVAAPGPKGVETPQGPVNLNDNTVPAESPPSVAVAQAAEQMPETETHPVNAGAARQVPLEQIATRPALMQFKES